MSNTLIHTLVADGPLPHEKTGTSKVWEGAIKEQISISPRCLALLVTKPPRIRRGMLLKQCQSVVRKLLHHRSARSQVPNSRKLFRYVVCPAAQNECQRTLAFKEYQTSSASRILVSNIDCRSVCSAVHLRHASSLSTTITPRTARHTQDCRTTVPRHCRV